jgi:hypothetical protein
MPAWMISLGFPRPRGDGPDADGVIGDLLEVPRLRGYGPVTVKALFRKGKAPPPARGWSRGRALRRPPG